MARRKGIVAGSLGVTGRALVGHLVSAGAWDVVGISRRRPEYETGAQHLALDLLDRAACQAALAGVTDVDTIFFAALQHFDRPADNVGPNLTMLRNLVETVEQRSPGLRRVVLVEGAKYYGIHLGPFTTPAREDDPRHLPPNFYYDQEDWLRARQVGKDWHWSVVRPLGICGFAVGNPQNIFTNIALYAVICRELGRPLRFPGPETAYHTLRDLTDAGLLARAMEWAATAPAARNEAFNIANGTTYRWDALWPKLADFFGMEVAPPQGLSLQEFMADKGPVWEGMVAKYGLKPYRYEEIAVWRFADIFFRQTYDAIFDVSKARRAGFDAFVDNEEMFRRHYSAWQREKIIP